MNNQSWFLVGSFGGWKRWGMLAGVLAVGVTATEVADACTFPRLPPALDGYPGDGAVDVPIDVVPFYDAGAAELGWDERGLRGGTLTLRDANGTEVPITLQEPHPGTLALVPGAELEPNAHYSLELAPSDAGNESFSTLLEFETGTQRAAAPEPPPAFLQHYEFLDGQEAACASNWRRGTCLAFPAGVTLVGTYADAHGTPWGSFNDHVWTKPTFVDLTGIDQGTPYECVELRMRAANGTFSEPTRLCGADAPFFELDGNDGAVCTPDGISFQGRLVTDSAPSDAGERPTGRDSGCSVTGSGKSANGLIPWLMLLAGARLIRDRIVPAKRQTSMKRV
jgi:hypothetical protein